MADIWVISSNNDAMISPFGEITEPDDKLYDHLSPQLL